MSGGDDHGTGADPFVSVMTTIQEPTPSTHRHAAQLQRTGSHLIVVGDQKGPPRFDLPRTRFVPLAEQLALPFKLAPLLPTGHYVRKNLAYLLAFQAGADRIYETDDDNAPAPDWIVRTPEVHAEPVATPGWFNVYHRFTHHVIWPRGFPLDKARDPVGPASPPQPAARILSPIQQELANVAPDVDAVWRLTIASEPFTFDPARRTSVHLAPGAWCPFNSQATWWFPPAFPLMYLPGTCTFRMTDIWRSLVAQRCLWELNLGATFHPPQVEQERNAHDLMRDFADEVPGYLHNHTIARTLESLSLRPGQAAIPDNLIRCHQALISAGFLKPHEMELLRAWIADVESISEARPA
ncbi:MAG TPA: STELLO glycosyltransferase family protein [Tepidisphaeraceae bacterium]|jgi:hypothetical protein